MADLFVPLTPANPAAPKPKCRRHGPYKERLDLGHLGDSAFECLRCGNVTYEAQMKMGRRNRQRGNSIERELGKKLGMARTGQFGGKDDLSNALFKAQVKSGGYFSERQWAWLKTVPVQAGQTALLVIADTPGPGKRRRAMVMLDLEDWRELHGEADSL